MRILKKALPVWGAFFIACFMPLVAVAQCFPDHNRQSVIITHVYDGDTVRLSDGRRIRLIGINTPELAKDGRPAELLAFEARRFLQQQLQGQKVELSLEAQKQDRYKRWLGHFWIDGRLLAEAIVREGLAYAIAVPPNLNYLPCLFQAERIARENGKGLWQRNSWVEVKSLKVGDQGFRLLTGRVSAVKKIKSGWIVEVDDLLAIKLSHKMAGQYAKNDFAAMQNKRVYLRGWIRPKAHDAPAHYQPWFMSLSHKKHMLLGL